MYEDKEVWKLDATPRKGGVAPSVIIAVSYLGTVGNQQVHSSIVADDTNIPAKSKMRTCSKKTGLRFSIVFAVLSPNTLTTRCAGYEDKAVWKLDVTPQRGGVAPSVIIAVSYCGTKGNQQVPSSIVAHDPNTPAKGKCSICNRQTRFIMSIPFAALSLSPLMQSTNKKQSRSLTSHLGRGRHSLRYYRCFILVYKGKPASPFFDSRS